MSSALPFYYCGRYGNAFYIYWFTNSAGNLDFDIQYAGPCSGGPYTWGAIIMSNQEGTESQKNETSTDIYNAVQYSTFTGSGNEQIEIDFDSLESIVVNIPKMEFYYVDPEKISINLLKELAKNEKKSIVALTTYGNDCCGRLKFSLWSTKDQTIQLTLTNLKTGNTMATKQVSIKEGKNSGDNLGFNDIIPEYYVLEIKSDENTITKTVLIN
jgi:hypothetical protein